MSCCAQRFLRQIAILFLPCIRSMQGVKGLASRAACTLWSILRVPRASLQSILAAWSTYEQLIGSVNEHKAGLSPPWYDGFTPWMQSHQSTEPLCQAVTQQGSGASMDYVTWLAMKALEIIMIISIDPLLAPYILQPRFQTCLFCTEECTAPYRVCDLNSAVQHGALLQAG